MPHFFMNEKGVPMHDSPKGTYTAADAAQMLHDHIGLLRAAPPGPVLDIACGHGAAAILAASTGRVAVGCDINADSLERARAAALERGIPVRMEDDLRCLGESVPGSDLNGGMTGPQLILVRKDLEQPGVTLPRGCFASVIVFRYLFRPLVPAIREALRPGGILFYETFTEEHARFGKPSNPDFLLKPNELKEMFEGWPVCYAFEGLLDDPPRHMARRICHKPGGDTCPQ